MYDHGRPLRSVAFPLILGVLILACASCAKKESTSESTSATQTPTAETTSPPPAITDANIAAIVVAANTADIENGKQAESKSKDAAVKSFARQMVTDHTSVNDKATALAKKLSLTPEDNDTSRGIKTSQDSVRTALMAKSGTEFNKEYVDNEVSYHQMVLDAIDNALIPNAQNPELKQLLTDTRPAIAAHLDHAKLLQSKLGAAPSQ